MDVFALTSKNEAKPVSILEALACCVPVVAPDVGSVSESVIEGETGHLVVTRSPEDYANTILRLLQNHSKRDRMGKTGRELVCSVSSLDAMVVRLRITSLAT